MLTAYGVIALTFMMAMYAFEQRHRNFVLAFAAGCALSSSYGFLSGAWPFGVVEGIWTIIAVRRWATISSASELASRVGLGVLAARCPGQPGIALSRPGRAGRLPRQ